MAYTRLLRAYYHHEQAIAEGQQYRLAKATTPTQRKAVDQVLAEFFELRDGRWHQKRADEEIARYRDKQAKAKRSAEVRWSQRHTHDERNANASPNAMRAHSGGNALQTPDTRHQTPEENSPVEVFAEHSVAKAPPRPRGTRLSSDWKLPRDWGEWALEQPGWTEAAVRLEAEKFADYWHAKAGRDATKADWGATWRNWVRNANPPRSAAVVPLVGKQAAIEQHNRAVVEAWLAQEGAS